MQQHLKDQLVKLQQCLEALPMDLLVLQAMESKYKFSDFSPDAEWAADIGEAGAVNQELEIRFGNCVDVLKPVERGPETEKVPIIYPFDHELQTDETAYEWWSHLDKDSSGDAQPLAACDYIVPKLTFI
ncbi:hypothetical protein BDR07DRAFT_1493607 [Suillus spraguei]|nr:hypothetical protein BDR07DRAFT_1493607 [Suillus spraguei]